MNILVTGACGFVGSQIVTDLIKAGHSVTCCVRNKAYTTNLFPDAHIISCDFVKDTSKEIWISRLKNIDVVINAVGILYHPNQKIIWSIHYDTPRALFDACVVAGVKKIIQISALGVNKTSVDYAKSKKAADDYLVTLPITSIILRPSLIYGRGSYGGTSLFRGLAGLPWLTPVPGKGQQEFQPIHLQDLSKAILHLAEKPLEKSSLFAAVGPTRVNLTTILTTLRRWLGFSKAKLVFIPLYFIRLGSYIGNFIPYSSMNTTSYKMLMQNNIASNEEAAIFHQQIGFIPRDFITGVYDQPSTVQDHWHAKLYFLKPLLQVSIAFIWLFTALCSAFFYPATASYELLAKIGINDFWQPIVLYGASILDAFIGIAMLCGYQLKKICLLQIIFILLYTAVITWKLPYLWLDPFAPIAKNIPLLASILVFLALESDK